MAVNIYITSNTLPFCSSNRYLQSASLLDESYADIRNLLPYLLITWCHNCYIFSYIIYGIHTTILSNLNGFRHLFLSKTHFHNLYIIFENALFMRVFKKTLAPISRFYLSIFKEKSFDKLRHVVCRFKPHS